MGGVRFNLISVLIKDSNVVAVLFRDFSCSIFQIIRRSVQRILNIGIRDFFCRKRRSFREYSFRSSDMDADRSDRPCLVKRNGGLLFCALIFFPICLIIRSTGTGLIRRFIARFLFRLRYIFFSGIICQDIRVLCVIGRSAGILRSVICGRLLMIRFIRVIFYPPPAGFWRGLLSPPSHQQSLLRHSHSPHFP